MDRWSMNNLHPIKCPPSPKRLIDYIANRRVIPYYAHTAIDLARNHPPFLNQLDFMKNLPVHYGCVNTICWDETGEFLLSGSDDGHLVISKPTYMFDHSPNYSVAHKIRTKHVGNIFSAKFLPKTNSRVLVSCSTAGPVIVHDLGFLDPSEGIFNFNCHWSVIFEVVTLGDSDKVFMTCSEDKTIRLFDLRCHRSCSSSTTCTHPAQIRNSQPYTTISVNPINPNQVLAGLANGKGMIYDLRKLPDVTTFSKSSDYSTNVGGNKGESHKVSWEQIHPLNGVLSIFELPDKKKCRFTSLSFSKDSSQILASYAQDYVYLFNHDKSSNVDLIQTLPTRPVSEPNVQSGEVAEDDSSSGLNNSLDDRGDDQVRGNKSKVSPELKMKFQKTCEALKSRFAGIHVCHPGVKYQGHRNLRTVIKDAIFWGDDYIMSGSDCGRIMIWEKNTARLLMAFKGDERVVNCLAPNPHHYVLASSGIDYDIKIWSTQSLKESPLSSSQNELDFITESNERKLEALRRSVQVSPHLFFRFLTSITRDRLS